MGVGNGQWIVRYRNRESLCGFQRPKPMPWRW
jgi:hypothetical protein